MCSGRVDPAFVLRAFARGVDGVFLGGCRLNECNYTTQGNYHALNMVLLLQRVLEHLGLNPERLKIAFMSGAEATVFVEVVNRFVQRVKELGPLGVGEGLVREEVRRELGEVTKLVPYLKLVEQEKLGRRLKSAEEYEGLFPREEVARLFREVVSYYIEPEKCQACLICGRRCPEGAIAGGKNQVHVVDQGRCIKCGTCYEVCPSRFGAVRKVTGEPVPPSLPEADRTIVKRVKDKEAKLTGGNLVAG